MKLERLIIFISILILGVSCNEHEDLRLNFVGDSLVARWPLSETFPSQYVLNYGISGQGIDYLESLSNRFIGETIIVQIGTNNNNMFTPSQIDQYLERYINALSATGAGTIYLYSLLPREFNGDPGDINQRISTFNLLVSERVSDIDNIIYIDVYNRFMYGDHINYQYYSDGLHLNIYGYEVLTKALLDKLKY